MLRNLSLLTRITMAIAMALPNVAWCQISSVVNDESSSDYTLRVTANLVQLNAVVMDRHKALVSGLSKDNFHIYEDNILQQIKHFSHEDAPVTVGLVIDNSGSMGPKRADLIAAALSFAHSSNPLDQIFVLNFNEHVSYGLPKGVPFTDRPDQLQLALSTIQTIGETALYDAIASALDHLKQSTCDKKVLIVISDGGDNASTHSLAQILDRSRDSSAIIYTIGIFDDQDGDQNPEPLKKLANQTGGEAFFPQSSRDITSICEGIARDIRNQYTLAYIPSILQRVGGYRRVEVKASSPDHGKLSVRTRTGYSVLAENLQTTRMVGHESHP